MSGQNDDTEKSHDASEKKLRDARKRGEIVRSTDVNVAAGYAGLWLGLAIFGAAWLSDLGMSMQSFLQRADLMATAFLSDPPETSISTVSTLVLPTATAIFIGPFVFVVLSIVAMRGIVFAPNKLKLKASRISPISNAKNKFGASGFFEFFKSFAKLCLYSAILTIFLIKEFDHILEIAQLNVQAAIFRMCDLTLQLLFIVVVVSTCLAVVDYTYQRAAFLKKNRMSHKEIRDEMKESEGDPTMKAARRGRAQEIALNGMMADVPDADVVIVNPTHFAVALQWKRGQHAAPVCVAKGVDEVARTIREIAQDSGVPIHSDPVTARALFATIEVGQEIGQDMYAPVAAAIRFAEKMRQKAKAGHIW